MSFKEDIFAKIVTFITVTILLGSMLLEAFYIYREREENEELQQRIARAESNINSLVNTNRVLNETNTELQEFRDTWEELVILKDNEFCAEMRENLSGRPELIPEAAVENAVQDIDSENTDEVTANFSFPEAEEKDWLIPLNLGDEAEASLLFYARAEDEKLEKVIDLLYELSMNYRTGKPRKDENGEIMWKCIAFDAGNGWQVIEEEGK